MSVALSPAATAEASVGAAAMPTHIGKYRILGRPRDRATSDGRRGYDDFQRRTAATQRVGSLAYTSPDRLYGGAGACRADPHSLGGWLYHRPAARPRPDGPVPPAPPQQISALRPSSLIAARTAAWAGLDDVIQKALAK